jgi:hypothetical protein
LLGVLAYLVLVGAFAASGFAGFRWFGADTRPGLAGVILVPLAASLGTGALSRLGTARQPREPTRRTAGPASVWRLFPVWLGLLGLATLMIVHHLDPSATGLFKYFLAAAALAVVGAVAAVRPLTEALASALGNRARQVSTQLAARRLRVAAAGTCRVLTPAIGVVLVAAIGAGILRTVQLAAGPRVQHQVASVPVANVPLAARSRAVAQLPAGAFAAKLTTNPTAPPGAALSPDAGTASLQLGVGVTYATCSALRHFDVVLASLCRAGRAYRVQGTRAHPFPNDLPVGATVRVGDAHLRVPAARLLVDDLDDGFLDPDTLFVATRPPPALPPSATYEFALPARDAALARFQDALARLSITATAQFDAQDLDQLRTYTLQSGIVAAATGGAFALSLAAFLVAAADRARERRRAVAAMVAIGVGRRTIRLSHAVEIVLPALVGVAAATLVGALVGTAYVNLDGELQHGVFLGTATAALPMAVLTVIVVPGAGLLLGGRRVRPAELRRE